MVRGEWSRRGGRVLLYTLPTAGLTLAALAVAPELLRAARTASAAQPHWMGLAAAGFLCAAIASAGAWWSALRASNGTIQFVDATSRYAVGSLVNTFVPARLGDAVRIGLLSRAFEERNCLLRTTGVFAFLGIARAAALALVLLPAVARGLLPARLLVVSAGLVLAATTGALVVRRRAGKRVSILLDPFALICSLRVSVRIVGWQVLGTLARVTAAAASAAALGVPNPVAAAVIIVPALELSSLLPLTPGNIGITSAVIALALKAHGLGMGTALAVGIAFHAVETVVGVSFGLVGTVRLVGTRFPLVPRLAAAGALLAAFVVVGGMLGSLPDVT